MLRHSGRNQFGDHGSPTNGTSLSAAPSEYDRKMWQLHRQLHADLVARFSNRWLKLFADKSKKEAWLMLHNHSSRNLSLATFYKHAAQYSSFEEYLLYRLVSDIPSALKRLGVPPDEIVAEMMKYADCGRYYVTYGAGKELFGTVHG
ncbi:hypothetical protein GTP81_08235 [Rugamonas sp. FT107W]|uniref:Uncharacterized protein n=1 Tax=Duganella vulcania TaxID=2692166 RepID=A0A845HGV5_9BURK|nr:hypothetical protein [Duganella vulcania]MYN16739.1 hypothetical protein [Duganella vulcania]